MIYEYECETCKDERDRPTRLDIYKPLKDCTKPEFCPKCKSLLQRVYTFERTPEFVEFYDETYGKTITSNRQEKKLMKEHGHIDARDNDRMRHKFASDLRRKQKRMVYSYAGQAKRR